MLGKSCQNSPAVKMAGIMRDKNMKFENGFGSSGNMFTTDWSWLLVDLHPFSFIKMKEEQERKNDHHPCGIFSVADSFRFVQKTKFCHSLTPLLADFSISSSIRLLELTIPLRMSETIPTTGSTSVVFPSEGYQVLSTLVHLLGCSVLSFCFARRLEWSTISK
jgi:hypothetical protein